MAQICPQRALPLIWGTWEPTQTPELQGRGSEALVAGTLPPEPERVRNMGADGAVEAAMAAKTEDSSPLPETAVGRHDPR